MLGAEEKFAVAGLRTVQREMEAAAWAVHAGVVAAVQEPAKMRWACEGAPGGAAGGGELGDRGGGRRGVSGRGGGGTVRAGGSHGGAHAGAQGVQRAWATSSGAVAAGTTAFMVAGAGLHGLNRTD